MLDRSRSMYGKERMIVEGYNAYIRRQKETGKQVYVTTVLFNTGCELFCCRTPLRYAKPLDERTYYVDGSTAIYDAVAETFALLEELPGWQTPQQQTQVTAVIVSDGTDNASIFFGKKEITAAIRQKRREGWNIEIKHTF